MSYGKKCNIIFIRKVRNRIKELEERYKDLDPRERAGKINQELASFFCVEPRQITNWKIAERISSALSKEEAFKEIDFLGLLSPTILIQLNRLKTRDDLIKVAKKAIEEKLTVREVKALVNEMLGKKEPVRTSIVPTAPEEYDFIDRKLWIRAYMKLGSRLLLKLVEDVKQHFSTVKKVVRLDPLELEKVKADLVKEIPNNDNLFHPLLEEWEKLHPYKRIIVRDKTSEELENDA